MFRNSAKSLVVVEIHQGHKKFKRSLKVNEKLTVGRSPDNDVILFDQSFPKKHTLFEIGHDICTLNLNDRMTGEICYQESRLSIQDLIIHDLLPVKGGSRSLKFTHGRTGHVQVGDVDINFEFNGTIADTSGLDPYSWRQTFGKALSRDVLYKVLVLGFGIFEILFAVFMSRKEFILQPPSDVQKVPQRFVQFIVQKPIQESELKVGLDSGSGGKDSQDSEAEQRRRRRSSGDGGGDKAVKRPVGSQGLLGLIGGSDESARSSSTVDFLVGEGLVQELDQMLGRQTFVKNKGIGRGGGTGDGTGGSGGDGDDLDDLVAFGASGGIDDLISDVSNVATVNMTKQGNVNIEAPRNVRGSSTAKGYRTVDKVNAVIRNQYGRIMHTYNKYLKSDPDLGGKISLDLTINAGGRVSDIQILESTIQNQDFLNDVMRIIRGLRFEPIPEGSVTVYLPLVFSRTG
ncbi:energy transducer TonB [candidate division KSB1 bacterium]|nr:energy transducer TonB [candidate division KSB1 bacterium]